MIIKVCGMREPENVAQVQEIGIDMMGFIFYDKSPRYVAQAPCTKNVARVGVFVNEDADKITAIAMANSLTHIQLHGSETPALCAQIRKKGYKVIKAINIKEAQDLTVAKAYEGIVDYLLFDTKCTQHGGSGKTFDWELLNFYKGSSPFLLSGGIKVELAECIKQLKHPQLVGVDLNSGFEISPAHKDITSLTTFINKIQ